MANGYLLTTGTIALLCWRYVDHALYMREGHIVTGLLKIPVWPFVLLSAFFIGLFALSLLNSLLNNLNESLAAGNVKTHLWLLPGTLLVLGLFLVLFSLFLQLKS